MSNRPALPQIDLEGVAARLEALRATTGLSRDAFSTSFGLDPSSYTKIANAKGKPLKSEFAFAISQIWGVTMDYLYRGDLSKIEDALRAKIMAALNSPER